jgi:hypothetical protein
MKRVFTSILSHNKVMCNVTQKLAYSSRETSTIIIAPNLQLSPFRYFLNQEAIDGLWSNTRSDNNAIFMSKNDTLEIRNDYWRVQLKKVALIKIITLPNDFVELTFIVTEAGWFCLYKGC